jgi:hypothetical protein
MDRRFFCALPYQPLSVATRAAGRRGRAEQLSPERSVHRDLHEIGQSMRQVGPPQSPGGVGSSGASSPAIAGQSCRAVGRQLHIVGNSPHIANRPRHLSIPVSMSACLAAGRESSPEGEFRTRLHFHASLRAHNQGIAARCRNVCPVRRARRTASEQGRG